MDEYRPSSGVYRAWQLLVWIRRHWVYILLYDWKWRQIWKEERLKNIIIPTSDYSLRFGNVIKYEVGSFLVKTGFQYDPPYRKWHRMIPATKPRQNHDQALLLSRALAPRQPVLSFLTSSMSSSYESALPASMPFKPLFSIRSRFGSTSAASNIFYFLIFPLAFFPDRWYNTQVPERSGIEKRSTGQNIR